MIIIVLCLFDLFVKDSEEMAKLMTDVKMSTSSKILDSAWTFKKYLDISTEKGIEYE